MRHHPAVDEVVEYDGSSALQKAAFLLRLRLRRWDLWLDLHTPTPNTFGSVDSIFRRNVIFMRAARSRYRVGFDQPALAPYLTHPVQSPTPEVLSAESIVRTTLRLVPEAAEEHDKRLYLPPDLEAWSADFLRKNGLEQSRIIGLFFGAKQPAKFWPLDNVLEFCRLLVERFPETTLLLFGGSHELETAQALLSSSPPSVRKRIVNLVTTTSLLQSAALMKHCMVIVSTDSGPMHMAEALGRPLVALMSSHNHLPVWSPLASNAHVLNVPVPCGPCFRSTCDHGSLCMTSITPGSVMDRVESCLAGEVAHA
jgi:heptosyltransferase-2